jgi:multiple sugar transport system permease protein
VFVGAMAVFPLGYSLVLSFRDWKLARSPLAGEFVGLSNYINLLTDDPDFLEAVRVTAFFVTTDVLVTVLVSLAGALLLHRSGRLNSLARLAFHLDFF